MTINSEGTVVYADDTAAVAGADIELTITAKGQINIDEVGDTGNVTATTTTGDVFFGEDVLGAAAGDTDTDGQRDT